MESNIEFITRRLAELPDVPSVPEQDIANPEEASGENEDRAEAVAARSMALDTLLSELEQEKGALVRRRGDFLMIRLDDKLVRSESGPEDALKRWLDDSYSGETS